LQDIPLGVIFAVILYVAMIFAGISSLQNMFEAACESIEYKFPRLPRKLVLVVLGVVCLGVGVNMETIGKWGPFMDIVSIYIIPIGALLGAISWFYVMKKEDLLSEINKGANKLRGNVWYYLGRYLYVPCALILCIVALFMGIAF
jgi:NSS family neurotransmitter:Na+ symporter